MGGLVLDVLLAFLFRILANWFRRVRSRKWPVAIATVHRSADSGAFFGDATTISYDYVVNGERYSGSHDVPCLSGSAAKYMVQVYSPGKEIKVRYKPDDPSRSVALV
jgi:hypothetical protein